VKLTGNRAGWLHKYPIFAVITYNAIMQSFTINHDRVSVRAYSWLPDIQPVAALQIVHGMQEHALRYDHFARWLNEHGIAVYAEDHIGHGSSIGSMDDIAHFPRKGDWQRQVDILHELTLKIKSGSPGLPVFLLGHSMGSVLTQSYMIRYGTEADGFILSGAIRQPVLMANFGIDLSKILSFFFGARDRSRLIIKLGYGQYNKHFRPNRTGADWLCSKNQVVDDYIASPLCGVPLTNMFYRNFFNGFRFIAKPKNLKKVPDGKPVLIIAGKDDPAGFFGKAPQKIKELQIKYAKADARLKLYPGMRHEILNEKDREMVYKDVFSFITKL
jgi:alpha-beta hydrolase superfamily lysophospholipase